MLLAPKHLRPKKQEAAPLHLGLAQEIHRCQVLQLSPVGLEDFAPGNLPRLQEGLFLEGGPTDAHLSSSPGLHLLKALGFRAEGSPDARTHFQQATGSPHPASTPAHMGPSLQKFLHLI